MLEFETIRNSGIAEIVEKKSRFIASIFYVETKEKAEEKIKEMKKKYSDAKHNCYAYCVMNENSVFTKSSDDGEPSSTAGIPILNVIKERKLVNVLVIVTRYFGGILLGTGGLVRAYSKATVKVINNSDIIRKEKGYEVKIMVEYNNAEFLKYYLNQKKCKIIEIIYSENVEMNVEISKEIKEELLKGNSKIADKIKKIVIIEEKYIEKSSNTND